MNDWRQFYNRHGGEMAGLSGSEAALWSKLEGTAPRLALIIHLVRAAARDQTLQTPDAVDETSLAAAIRLADWFGFEGRRIYAVLRDTSEVRVRRELVELIERNGGSITERELQRSGRRFGTAEACETLLQDLVRRGLGNWKLLPAGQQGGRPSRAFASFAAFAAFFLMSFCSCFSSIVLGGGRESGPIVTALYTRDAPRCYVARRTPRRTAAPMSSA